MDTWTRRIEGNLFFSFYSSSHWISYLECMYTQNPAASISIYNNPIFNASATKFPNIIIFQYSDFCLLRERGVANSSLKDHFLYSHDQINRSIVFSVNWIWLFWFWVARRNCFFFFSLLFFVLEYFSLYCSRDARFYFRFQKVLDMAKEANKTGKEIKTKNPLDFILARL